MLQETVWALSNVQCPFCHVRAVFTEAATRGECSIKKVSIEKVGIKKS